MKKLFTLSIIMAVCIFTSTAIYGQDAKVLKAQKASAKTFISATTKVISQANTAKIKIKRAEGVGGQNIAKAYDHQKHAIELFAAGTFEKAIYHSLKARKYAAISLKEDGVDYVEAADAEVVFKDFRDPEEKDKDKKKANSVFFKSMKEVFKFKFKLKDENAAFIGEAESLLDADIEKTADDKGVTPALIKEMVVK